MIFIACIAVDPLDRNQQGNTQYITHKQKRISGPVSSVYVSHLLTFSDLSSIPAKRQTH